MCRSDTLGLKGCFHTFRCAEMFGSMPFTTYSAAASACSPSKVAAFIDVCGELLSLLQQATKMGIPWVAAMRPPRQSILKLTGFDVTKTESLSLSKDFVHMHPIFTRTPLKRDAIGLKHKRPLAIPVKNRRQNMDLHCRRGLGTFYGSDAFAV